MKKHPARRLAACLMAAAALLQASFGAAAELAKPGNDPAGVLRKPIPDKLVVLTFDDGPLSGYTVCAPILKSFGFGGSFYVCDFDSFKTRKDWYMTWRQMKAMTDDGFEIGNHSVGHFSGLGPMLALDDELLANGVPQPTTIAWPVFAVAWKDCPALASNGYLFARGGHFRPYRPTVDHPFDVPCLAANTMEEFVKSVRQATGGKIAVIIYHGVPDMEHRAVSLEPEVFKTQMQYLKDNHYKVIAMRDLADYIDPVKAATLPQTVNEWKDPGPVMLAAEDKPYVDPGNVIQHFGFRDLPGGTIIGTSVRVTVPYALDVTALVPVVRLPAAATLSPGAEVARDFSKPQTYMLTSKDGSTKTYTVSVDKTAAGTAKEMLTFALPEPASVAISGNRIGVSVPDAADVTKLAPTFTLPPFARATPAAGTIRDFTRPQTYTVAAQDGSTRVYTVQVAKSARPSEFTWIRAESGNWSDGSKWANALVPGAVPRAAGQADYLLRFNQPGKYEIANDLKEGFLINQLDLGTGEGDGLTLAGNSLKFVNNDATGVPPGILQQKAFQKNNINMPIDLAADLQVLAATRSFLRIEGVISGTAGLTYHGNGTRFGGPNADHSTLFIATKGTNSYSGGTTINGGRVWMYCNNALGTGPVTMNGGQLICSNMSAPLTFNNGVISGGADSGWNAPIVLNGTAILNGSMRFNEKSGGISGPGGLTMEGTWATWSIANSGVVSLHGTNTYTGPTTVLQGTIAVKKAASLYNADPAMWTAAKISVCQTATLQISVGGPDEFTGAQVSSLLENLTKQVDGNGLLAGSTFCLDSTNAAGVVELAGTIADAKGPGGGAFTFKTGGSGTLRLSGGNTYTGQTIMTGGTLVVASLNRVVKGTAASSLGVPSSLETGIIELGGDCCLKYTGEGETTDRIINFTGEKQTVTLDQSGGGLLKFTSPFDISGFGHSKTLVLTGTGAGELAGAIADPYDRKRAATMALTKTGVGTWTLSGTNRQTGPTTVSQGTLCVANARGLGESSEVSVADGAMLELGFKGGMKVARLALGGQTQPAGSYNATNAPKFIKGTGSITCKQ